MLALYPEIIAQCQRGDRTAQRRLFEQLYPYLYRICLRYIGGQSEAEDCVMRTFMKAFGHLDTFHYTGENSFFFWIRKIAVREALMSLRKVRNFSMVPVEDVTEQALNQDDVFNHLDAELLYRLILELPMGYRTVFNLYVVEGYTHEEIAAMLAISANTSRTQLAKAKLKLRTLLINYGYEPSAVGR